MNIYMKIFKLFSTFVFMICVFFPISANSEGLRNSEISESLEYIHKYKKILDNYILCENLDGDISLYRYVRMPIFVNNLHSTYNDGNDNTRYVLFCYNNFPKEYLLFDTGANCSGNVVIGGIHIKNENVTINPGNYNGKVRYIMGVSKDKLKNIAIRTEKYRHIQSMFASHLYKIINYINNSEVDKTQLARDAIEFYNTCRQERVMIHSYYKSMINESNKIVPDVIDDKETIYCATCPDSILNRSEFEKKFYYIFDMFNFCYSTDDSGNDYSQIKQILGSVK